MAGDFPVLRRTITAAMVRLYGQINDDNNALHYDRAAAQAAGFPDCIAHGAITAALVHEACREAFGAAWFHAGRLKVTFVAPVLVGETVTVAGRLLGAGEAEITCLTDSGRTVLVAHARCRAGGGVS